MATKKAVAAKDMVLAKTDLQLLKDVISIADLATKFGTEATVTTDNLDKAVEVLARVREANRKLEAMHKLAVADLKAQLKVIDDEKKALSKQLEAADDSVAAGIIKVYTTIGEETYDRRQAGSLGSSATVVPNRYIVEVVNANEVPDEFILEPLPRAARVNTAAIAEVLKAGGKVPGVKFVRTYYITTRASDTIKKVAS